ncbi:hypothetical protein [Bradyrhizobium japonicum]|uniref:hypothetical protein n=1 Tax=Bradyrhizobium japonicum TaxID=375 RepID=UPI0027150AF4|nr:hypothetical protein [Bradyrhizobium japonicum]WLB24272.1 hypothetical protein QIH95_47840 [Bradyrhizobium japonicum]
MHDLALPLPTQRAEGITHERTEIDREDEELPDKHAAWLVPGRDWRMEVTDEFQNTLYVLLVQAQKPK